MENLGVFLRAVLQNDADAPIAEVERSTVYENQEVVKILLKYKSGHLIILVDLAHGAVPLKIVGQTAATATSPGHQSVFLFDDVRYIPNCGWLPFKESWWHGHSNTGGQIIIKDAKWDVPPDASAFDIVFASPTSIVDDEKGLRYPPKRVWNVSRLPSRGTRGVEKVVRTTIPGDALPKLPGEIDHEPRYYLAFLGVVALISSIALLVWFRRRNHG